MSAIQTVIDKWSNVFGVPTWVSETIAQEESGMNPTTIGDNGTSYGLFQLHQGGGQGDGYTPTQLEDPETNAKIGIAALAPAYKNAQLKGLQGYDLVSYVASHSGHPDYTGTLPQSYDQQLQAAYQQVTGGSSSSGSSTGGTSTVGGVTGPPSGNVIFNAGDYIRAGFWGILGIGIVLLGIWVLLNPFSDLSSAIRTATKGFAQMPLEGMSRRIRNAPDDFRFRGTNTVPIPDRKPRHTPNRRSRTDIIYRNGKDTLGF